MDEVPALQRGPASRTVAELRRRGSAGQASPVVNQFTDAIHPGSLWLHTDPLGVRVRILRKQIEAAATSLGV
jgi:hypothetical protein